MRSVGIMAGIAAGLLVGGAAPAPAPDPMWQLVPLGEGRVMAKATDIGPVKSIAVACVEGKPAVIVKLTPGTVPDSTTLGVEWITNRQEAPLLRHQTSDGWLAIDPPATLLDTMALNGGAVLKIGGKPAGRLPTGGNAKQAISQALAPCLANAGAKPLVATAGPAELRGIRPGMTMASAQAALKAAGFPIALTTYSSTWRPADARITRYKPYDRADMEFDSTFMVVKRPIQNNWRGDMVVVAMTPPPNNPVVWAVGQGTHYAPGAGPSGASTTAALVAKFGRPTAADHNALAWYWDRGGRQLGANVHSTCRQIQHNTYLVNQSDDVMLRGFNLAAVKGDWLGGAVKAGCATSLVAQWNVRANDEVEYLEIKLVDFVNGDIAAQRTFALAQSKANAAANAAKQGADSRRPAF